MITRRYVYPLIAATMLAAIGAPVVIHLHQQRKEEKEQRQNELLFTKRVAPLLESRCIRCHGPEQQQGDLRLDSLEAAMLGGKNGPAIIPGEAGKSLILKRLCHTNPKKVMPPRKRLRSSKIADIKEWISKGAPWPRALTADPLPDKTSKTIIGDAWRDKRNPITQLFGGKRLDLWSLHPIANPHAPTVIRANWPHNPIDQFILSKIEATGLEPAPQADQRTLARRLYFDLTGLPPTPEQLQTYLQDTSSDAYLNLVNQLLNSPNYGEHWGRFWLDLVRYSDSNGFDYDEFRPHAWRYRDYVIAAFNADKPFDTFIREQLAGDEMVADLPQTPLDQDRLTATGFLRIGPYDNSAASFGEVDLCHHQVMSDLVETTGAAFLGLTFSCCRCHDHKVDPISQKDYFRLRAFFESVVPNDDLTLDLPPTQQQVRSEMAAAENLTDSISEIRAITEERIRDRKYHTLSKGDQELLAQDDDNLSSEAQSGLRQLKRQIEVSEPEIDTELNEQEKQRTRNLAELRQDLINRRKSYLNGFLSTDLGRWPKVTYLLEKGDFHQPKDIVLPGILSALNPQPLPAATTIRRHSSGRRTALADWLVSSKNPLTARVIVNRIWQQHFHTGLVSTPNDFGFSGSRPSHPELLDWLAHHFMENGWSIKQLHRLMVTSATYQQGLASQPSANDTQLFIGREPHRLSAEAIRDSFLQISGRLLPQRGGPPRWPELPSEILSSNPGLLVENKEKTRGWYPSPPDQTYVRSIYLVQKRSLKLPLLETFDLPENTMPCGQRLVSTVVSQALTWMNGDFTADLTTSLAERIQNEAGSEPASQVHRAFALALQRAPDDSEVTSSMTHLEQHGLPALCRALVNLNEFIYID